MIDCMTVLIYPEPIIDFLAVYKSSQLLSHPIPMLQYIFFLIGKVPWEKFLVCDYYADWIGRFSAFRYSVIISCLYRVLFTVACVSNNKVTLLVVLLST